MKTTMTLLMAAAGVLLASAECVAMDAKAAEAIVRKSGCLRCHGIDKKKDAPAYTEIAKKHKGEPGIEDKLVERAIKGDTVKIDGKEEDHGKFKTDDKDQIRNAIQWILSL